MTARLEDRASVKANGERSTVSRSHSNRKRMVGRVLTYGLSGIWILASLFPFYFTITTSLKLKRDVLDPTAWFFVPTLDNYVEIFTTRNITHYLSNSLFVAVGAVLPSLVLGLLAAYGLTRFGLLRERSIATTLLSFRMIPAIAVVIPYFLIAQTARLIDTHLLLIIAYTTANLPLAVWMLRAFMRQIPIEIDEAAQLDGASRMRILWRIHLPTITPGITSTGILLLIQSWNEFVFAQFLTSTDARTVPTTAGFFLSITGTNFGEMAAVAVIATLPPLTFAMIMRRRLVSGLSYGAV